MKNVRGSRDEARDSSDTDWDLDRDSLRVNVILKALLDAAVFICVSPELEVLTPEIPEKGAVVLYSQHHSALVLVP